MAMQLATKWGRGLYVKHHININKQTGYLTKTFFKEFGMSRNNINWVRLGYDKEKKILAFVFLRNKPMKYDGCLKFCKSGKTTNSFSINPLLVELNLNHGGLNGKHIFDKPKQIWNFSKKTFIIKV